MKEEKLSLIIMAAGMGSRYGGLKQLDSFTPRGYTIIDFSLFDALRAGFGKFVFVIRKSLDKEFKEIFNKKLEGKAEVEYVYQELEYVPKKYVNPERSKPWGTGHALLMAKNEIQENFAIINADDFYGREAFEVMAKNLRNKDKNSYDFSMVTYLLKNTVSDYGFVSRGICQVNGNGYLTDIRELTHIKKTNNEIIYKDEYGNFYPIHEDTIVSMNFFGFTPKCFEFVEELFNQVLELNEGNIKAEFYLPEIIKEILNSGLGTVQVLSSDAKWFGVTYKDDKEIVQKAIGELIEQNIYPGELW
ncbi:sugar phosphate nucleotidyltransferase [Yeosuana sp. MJ-SS3]|uniref:Sugar phosphate nucleotidyltransferase n=1 Tax=Gilvirhabdus luticola TaxID=3079858 RepID=A0ABU3U994_9FLAO|nr:sugar phosphate nucleotidyltransferase [Yeosuana sp. MJ-SS3]MDU8886988.1 sugar phosphate nucleotidyltransferase [Yeosuana sp. MJ-SS3]